MHDYVAEGSTSETRPSRRIPLPLIGVGAAVVLLIIFGVQNRREVPVTFLFWSVDTSLIWALLVTTVLGAAIGYFARWRRRSSRKPEADSR